ncbi:protein qui-1 [Cylas formicarius]|uniref:protein qui-1 n=1 Tax=Cylas formicarius TaxID=197179 RepID=UPI002958B1BB|nr:protein qui-1 [Cylas formicarius]
MKNNDETILDILQGHKTSKWPSAKLIKIFIASTKQDFINERRILLENVGPELQSVFDDHQLEVELVDMHFGAGEKDCYDPDLFQDHLNEIRICHKVSRGCFFVSLVGDKYDPLIVPQKIDSEIFSSLTIAARNLGLNFEVFEQCYSKSCDGYILKDIRSTSFEIWKLQSTELLNLMHTCSAKMPDTSKKKLNQYLKSIVEQQFHFALGLAPGTAHHVVSVLREFEPSNVSDVSNFYKENMEYSDSLKRYCSDQLNAFKSHIKSTIPEENRLCFHLSKLISWLRPVTERGGGLMSDLVTSAMAWCDGFTLPLVVPLNDWLQPPLPQQSKVMTTPEVRLVECTPNAQHVVVVVDTDPQLWHIMTNQLVHTFKGHKDKVNCMAVTKQSQYLLTGSDDISIIVWDLKSLSLRLKICEHIAPVLCITSALNNSVIISGGEDSSIIISSLGTGKLVTKIDHHRGPVTAIKVTSHGDIMVSGSKDCKVCLWSLNNYALLNTMTFCSPLQILDVSADSIFLAVCCKDNKIYIKTLATGTDVHTLVDHKTKVKSLCITQDSCRIVLGCSDKKVYIHDIHSAKLNKTLTGQNGEVSAVKIMDKDDFLLTAGGNRVIFYPFRSTDHIKSFLKVKKKSHHHLSAHQGFITCLDISRDGQLSVTGATDQIVNIWQLNNQELVLTLNGHTGPVTAVHFAPSALFVASGSEDKTVKVWGLTLGTLVSTFSRHQAAISAIFVMMDSTRIISSDINDNIYIWLSDNGTLLQSYSGPRECVKVTTNMKFAVATNGDTALKIWSLVKDDERYTVSHSEEITCFVLTIDSQHIITGSRDMSLKVWQIVGGKLSQVLIGHTDSVTCTAVAVSDKTHVVSGSYDNNLIVWDINTGADVHTLSAHLSYVTCCKMSGDGSIVISGSDDKSIIIWDTKQGLQLTSLQLHYPIVAVEPTSDFSRIAVLLKDTQYSPIICLHNTPAKYVKLPTYCAPDKDVIENPKPAPKRQMKRLLKKEVSLDTYTWQKKYAHLTSNLVIPSIDERFKRRFSVSASMEEISKIPQTEQKGMGSKQASLAQSQHFDQLEALWNKRSPPNRRKLHQSLSKQSSLAESQVYSSDEDHIDGGPS